MEISISEKREKREERERERNEIGERIDRREKRKREREREIGDWASILVSLVPNTFLSLYQYPLACFRSAA